MTEKEFQNILLSLQGSTERENRIKQECMRESQRWAVQELLKIKTEPTIDNLEGFYSLIN